MGVLLGCLDATGHEPLLVAKVGEALEKIAEQRPDLVGRYEEAFKQRGAGEMERLLTTCQELLDEEEDIWIGNLRINAVTKRFHVGNGNRSTPLFPHVQGI